MLYRVSVESDLVCALPPLLGSEALYLYVGGYAFLMVLLAGLVANLGVGVHSAGGSLFVLSISSQARLRWLLVYAFLSLAGLPPFFFFACKLGLLSLLWCLGSYLSVLGVAGLVIISWGAYYGIVRFLVTPVAVAPHTPLRLLRLSGGTATVLVLGGGLACVGLAIFEDACLLSLTYLR